MQGDPQIIELLNEVLTAELTAVNQYFLDAKMFDNWGYERLGERFRSESIDEMKDADHLIERLLYLDGHPNLQRLAHHPDRRGTRREAGAGPRPWSTRPSPASTTASPSASSGVTTEAGTCWPRSWRARRTTRTGWRASSRWSSSLARPTTWPSRSVTDADRLRTSPTTRSNTTRRSRSTSRPSSRSTRRGRRPFRPASRSGSGGRRQRSPKCWTDWRQTATSSGRAGRSP